MMVRVNMVVMERNRRGGDDDGVVCSGEDDVVEDGEVIVGIVTRMVARDVTGVGGPALGLGSWPAQVEMEWRWFGGRIYY